MTTIAKPSKHQTLSRISFVFIVFSLISPLSALAEDSKSIDILRQMGKAFASIAEKDSPAVVSIKANQAITQTYSGPLAIRLLTMNYSSNFSAGSSAGSSHNNSNDSPSKEKSSGPFRVPALSSQRTATSSQTITSSKTPIKSW